VCVLASVSWAVQVRSCGRGDADLMYMQHQCAVLLQKGLSHRSLITMVQVSSSGVLRRKRLHELFERESPETFTSSTGIHLGTQRHDWSGTISRRYQHVSQERCLQRSLCRSTPFQKSSKGPRNPTNALGDVSDAEPGQYCRRP
jgi:hypothetical protein